MLSCNCCLACYLDVVMLWLLYMYFVLCVCARVCSPMAALFLNRDGGSVVIRGYVPQGAWFYTRYYVYVIQWQRALVVYMSLGQLDS